VTTTAAAAAKVPADAR